MYEVGQTLSLAAAHSTTIKVRIHAIPHEFTSSAGLVVDIVAQSSSSTIFPVLPSRCFLKLFDRRCALDLREGEGLGKTSPEIEHQLLKLSRSGRAYDFLDEYRAARSERNDELSIAEKEVIIWDWMRESFEEETAAYNAMRDQQGHLVPKLYSRVWFDFPPSGSSGLDRWLLGEMPELFTTLGLLMEYIEGFRMHDLAKHAERSEWKGYITGAVKAVKTFHKDSRVINIDCVPINMIVEKTSDAVRFVMVDWATCRLRGEDEDDQSWAEAMAYFDPVVLFEEFMDHTPPCEWGSDTEDEELGSSGEGVSSV